MTELSKEAREILLASAAPVRNRVNRTGASGDFSRFAELSGKYAIVQPGKSVVVRLLPRWDIANRYIMQPGKPPVLNPEYPAKLVPVIFIAALSHWIDNPGLGRKQKLWCRGLINERCPSCDCSKACLAGSAKEDKALGKDMRQKEEYLFNAIIRDPKTGHAVYKVDEKTKKKVPDIRILVTPPALWVQIIDTMTGGPEGQAGFAKGEIFDPKSGYDLMITRPIAQGDRYKLGCANNPSPLFSQAEAPIWTETPWLSLLHNLEDEIGPDNILSYVDMYRAVYNEEPPEGEEGADTVTTEAAQVDPSGGGDGVDQAAAAGFTFSPDPTDTPEPGAGEGEVAQPADTTDYLGIGAGSIAMPSGEQAPATTTAPKAAPKSPTRPAPAPAAKTPTRGRR